MVTIIVAVGQNNEIGKDNQLLWHLPKDLQRFKKLTLNNPIIMGRKTFESLPGILPKRTHIVISRNKNYPVETPNVVLVSSLEEALALVNNQEAYIIGGGTIYEQSLNLADRIEITRVEVEKEADTFFPEIPLEEFELVYREYHPKDDKHPYNFEFITYQRKS